MTDARAKELSRRYERFFYNRPSISFIVAYSDGFECKLGESEASFSLRAIDATGDGALDSFDLIQIGEAYLACSLELAGDLLLAMSMRSFFRDNHPLMWAARFAPRLFLGSVRSDQKSIAHHYDEDPHFFRTFLDARHMCYTQGAFSSDDENLEDAVTRKLDYAISSLGLSPGDKILDVGGGWGAFLQFASERGFHVTSLTLSHESEQFMRSIVGSRGLGNAEVIREHFLQYKPSKRFHAIVNMGATEHLPDYAATLAQYQNLLLPGGKVYVDALAMKNSHLVSTFMSKHVYPGYASPLVLHKYLRAVAKSPFLLRCVRDERHNYYLSCRRWAERLDQASESVVSTWGEELYRRFRVFLWGSTASFWTGHLQAYSLVVQLPDLDSAGRH